MDIQPGSLNPSSAFNSIKSDHPLLNFVKFKSHSNKEESKLRLTNEESDFLALQSKIALASGIITRGGRTSVVRAVCGISGTAARRLHKEIHGQSPSSGLLPFDMEWVIRSPDNCLHSSVYYAIFQKLALTTTAASKGEIYLSAYILYEQTFENQKKTLDINRAWSLLQQLSMGTVSATICNKCSSLHVSMSSFPSPFKLCPMCDSTLDSHGRTRWKQVRLQYPVPKSVHSKHQPHLS